MKSLDIAIVPMVKPMLAKIKKTIAISMSRCPYGIKS